MQFPIVTFIKDIAELTADKWTANWGTLTQWWNDHDSGARAWTTVRTGSLTVTGTATLPFGPFQASVQVTSTTQTTTTSSTYQNTNLAASITPTSSAHRILITISGDLNTGNGILSNAILSIKRGSTELSTGGVGFAIASGVAGNQFSNAGITYIDSPATTSATTYTVVLKSSDNTTTVRFGNVLEQVITLTEIA